ncbi:MAG: AAA family ATPase [Hyphomicrobiaceae bacterium]|nr:AAA family ATPase [Hyphomicrobiaceae bacterium]
MTLSLTDIRAMLRIARSNALQIALPAIVLAALAVGYILTRTPTYTAHSSMVITNSKLGFSPDDAIYAESQVDPTFLLTQIEVLKSDKVALNVVDNLKLADSLEESADTEPSAGTAEGDPTASSNTDIRRQQALQLFKQNMQVNRVELSYVVDVAYSSNDANKAARVVNDITRAYLEDLDAARAELAQSASPAIRDRIKGIGAQVRIISVAAPPLYKSNIGGVVLLLGSIIGGLAIGLGWVFGRELFGKAIQTPDHAMTATGRECFGMLPWIANASKSGRDEVDLLNLSYAVDNPESTTWNTLRRVAVALDVHPDNRSGKLRRVGITSTSAGEGKTTVAAHLAGLIASTRARVLLLDCNIFHPTLSEKFGATGGILNVLSSKEAKLADFVSVDARTGVHVLPIGSRKDEDLSATYVRSEEMDLFLRQLEKQYDYVILDLPSMGPTYDVRAAADYCDHLLVVIDCGKVPADNLQVALALSGSAPEKLIGTVINRYHKHELKVLSYARRVLSRVPGSNKFMLG